MERGRETLGVGVGANIKIRRMKGNGIYQSPVTKKTLLISHLIPTYPHNPTDRSHIRKSQKQQREEGRHLAQFVGLKRVDLNPGPSNCKSPQGSSSHHSLSHFRIWAHSRCSELPTLSGAGELASLARGKFHHATLLNLSSPTSHSSIHPIITTFVLTPL